MRENYEYKKISKNEIIADVKSIALKLNKRSVSTKDYREYGKYSVGIALSRFGSWANVCNLAMLEPTNYRIITDEDLFNEIMRLWEMKGAQPTTTDIIKGKSIYSCNTYARHFGGFREALQKFIEYVNSDTKRVESEINNKSSNNITRNKKIALTERNQNTKHKTPREINLRLRYKVLLRDNFKCKICGASPSNDPLIKLHVDHIMPWSKGGETVIENLQTLCSKCNLGKSDIL